MRLVPTLTPWFCAMLVLIATGEHAQGHRLIVEHKLLKGNRVQIRARFESGDPPQQARIDVLRKDDSRFLRDHLDSKGMFVFIVLFPEPLRVVVHDITGHRTEHRIGASKLKVDLDRSLACLATACLASTDPPWLAVGLLGESHHASKDNHQGEDADPVEFRKSPFPLKDILVGLGFLLALAAFILSIRNARELAALKQSLKADKGVNRSQS